MDAGGNHSRDVLDGPVQAPDEQMSMSGALQEHASSAEHDGAGFDPEFYATAVGDDQDMDDIMSRMMDTQIARGGGGTAPASAATIARLKKREVDKSMLDDNGNAECVVCADEVRVGNTVTELPCTHWFHEACINKWLSSHGNCPHCRKNIAPDGEDTKPAESTKDAAGSPPQTYDPFDNFREELLERATYLAQHPSLHDDEAFARSLQEQAYSAHHDDEAFARSLEAEEKPSVHDDEAFARSLEAEDRPLLHKNEAFARKMQEEEHRQSLHDDAETARRMHEESEALLRRRQQENELTLRANEATARRMQVEADREAGYGVFPGNSGFRPPSHRSPASGGNFAPPNLEDPLDYGHDYDRADHPGEDPPSNSGS